MGRHLAEKEACAEPTLITLTNTGINGGSVGSFTGSVSTLCPTGLIADQPERSFIIAGDTFGPYNDSNIPSTITVSSGPNSGLLLALNGTTLFVNIIPQSEIIGALLIESELSASDNCGYSASEIASIILQCPEDWQPISNSIGSEIFGVDNGNGTQTLEWTGLNTGVQYQNPDTGEWIKQGIGLNSITISDEGVGLSFRACDFVCFGPVETLIPDYPLVMGDNFDESDRFFVTTGTQGSTDDNVNVETNPAYNYCFTFIASDSQTGTDFGEIVSIEGLGGTTGSFNFTNSFLPVANQAALQASFSDTTISPGGIVWDDSALYSALLDACLFSLGENTLVRVGAIVKEVASSEVSTNTVSNTTQEWCEVGFYTSVTGVVEDSQNPGEFFVIDLVANKIKRVYDGTTCQIIDTIYDIPQPGANRVHNIVSLPGPNGYNDLYFVERNYDNGVSSNSYLYRLSRDAGPTCLDERDNWTLSPLSIDGATNTRAILSYIEPSVLQVSSQGVFVREDAAGSIGIYYQSPVGNWNFQTLTGLLSSFGYSANSSIRQVSEDVNTGWIYGGVSINSPSEAGIIRMNLNNPGVDDPLDITNYVSEEIISIKARGQLLGDGSIAQVQTINGIYVDNTQIINSEPTIFAIDSSNNYILAITCNNIAGATGPSDWDVVVFAGSTTAGSADGIGTLATLAGPYTFDERVGSNGFISFADEFNARTRYLNLNSAEVLTFSPSPAPGASPDGDTLLH